MRRKPPVVKRSTILLNIPMPLSWNPPSIHAAKKYPTKGKLQLRSHLQNLIVFGMRQMSQITVLPHTRQKPDTSIIIWRLCAQESTRSYCALTTNNSKQKLLHKFSMKLTQGWSISLLVLVVFYIFGWCGSTNQHNELSFLCAIPRLASTAINY